MLLILSWHMLNHDIHPVRSEEPGVRKCCQAFRLRSFFFSTYFISWQESSLPWSLRCIRTVGRYSTGLLRCNILSELVASASARPRYRSHRSCRLSPGELELFVASSSILASIVLWILSSLKWYSLDWRIGVFSRSPCRAYLEAALPMLSMLCPYGMILFPRYSSALLWSDLEIELCVGSIPSCP